MREYILRGKKWDQNDAGDAGEEGWGGPQVWVYASICEYIWVYVAHKPAFICHANETNGNFLSLIVLLLLCR